MRMCITVNRSNRRRVGGTVSEPAKTERAAAAGNGDAHVAGDAHENANEGLGLVEVFGLDA